MNVPQHRSFNFGNANRSCYGSFPFNFNQTNTIINNFIYTTPSVKDKAKKKVNEEEFNSLEELLSALREESKLEISLNRVVIQKQ